MSPPTLSAASIRDCDTAPRYLQLCEPALVHPPELVPFRARELVLVHPGGSSSDVRLEPRRLLLDLTEAQRAAVMSDDSPLCVLAGAGSGKTTVLTRRVARRIIDGTADPDHVQVVTFTRKAAGELRSRLTHLGITGRVWAGTFHAAAYSQLRRHWSDRGRRPCAIVDDPIRMLSRIVGRSSHSTDEPASAREQARLAAAVAAEIHWAQVQRVEPEAYGEAARDAGRDMWVEPDRVAETYSRYREEKTRHGLVDLDDLLEHCAALLESDPDAAASQRWRIRHLFVDEFQDLNPAQWRLLSAWLGGREDLFVVGDPRQAVYGWNGADPTLIERLPDLLPGTTVLSLDQNHRCSPQIAAAARAVLDEFPGLTATTRLPNDSQRSERSECERSERSERSECERSERSPCPPTYELGADLGTGLSEPATPKGPDGPPPIVAAFDTDGAEAAALCRWLRQAHRPGRRWSHLAILARTHSRLEPIAAALANAGIPHQQSARTAPDPRSTPGSMRDVVRLLRSQPADRSIRSTIAELVVRSTEEAHPDTHPLPLTDEDSTGSDTLLGPILGLVRLADEHAAEEPGATVGAFLAWLTANEAASEAGEDLVREDDSVDLMTFHRAKGLEWRAVAVVGLEDGMVPIAYAATPEALAEERRLLYVAMTRAEEELWCSWAAGRRTRTGAWACSRSPFLEGVEDAVRRADPEMDLELWRSRISELRSCLPAVP